MEKKIKHGWKPLLLTVLLLGLLTACNLPSRVNEQGGNPVLTHAAQTAEAQLTLDALFKTPTVGIASSTPGSPTITIAPTSTKAPAATSTEVPCDAAGFIKDVSVPDGTEIEPGEKFTKIWRIENQGQCSWNSDYRIVFDDGDAMDGPASQEITSGSVAPGDRLDVEIEFTAPDVPGTYKAIYQLRNDDGVIFTFGGLWVEIKVIQPLAYTSKSSFVVGETQYADLDDGNSPTSDSEDFLFDAPAVDDKFISPENGAEFRLMGDDDPSYEDCQDAKLNGSEITIDEDLVEQWVCFITDDERLGKFQVVSLEPEDINQAQALELDYITWKTP